MFRVYLKSREEIDIDHLAFLGDTNHFIPASLMVGEVLDWLDQYFGPVQK